MIFITLNNLPKQAVHSNSDRSKEHFRIAINHNWRISVSCLLSGAEETLLLSCILDAKCCSDFSKKSDLLKYGSNVPKCCCKDLFGGLKPPDALNRRLSEVLGRVDFSTICAGMKHWVIVLTQTNVKNLQECNKLIMPWVFGTAACMYL